LGEELVDSYLYQVHLHHRLESYGYGFVEVKRFEVGDVSEMNPQPLTVEECERLIVRHAVKLQGSFVLRGKPSRSFLSSLPMIHANVDRLPNHLLVANWSLRRRFNVEEDPVDPGRAYRFPRTGDEFGVGGGTRTWFGATPKR
jgi:hypothetical protein